MEINMEFELFKYIVETFLNVTGLQIPEKLVPITIIFLFVVVILLIVLCRNLCRSHKWRKKQLDEILKGYEQYTTRQQRWLYIKTWFQSNPPHDLDEPYEAQFEDPRTDSIDFFIKHVLKTDNKKPPYYCILGGSGMGKSTFVVNLVWKYINKYREKTLPYPIKMIYCGETIEGNESLLDRIKKIDNKQSTILILDALDENNDAIVKYSNFFKELFASITDFRIVIITCRTQFFEKREEEPNILPVRDPATKEQKRFKKYYISPLHNDEVEHYLNKKYLLKFSAKRKAISIVNNCKKIMARPLLLSYLDDLLNADIDDSKESIVQIYDILIEKWLEREAYFAIDDDKKETYIQALRDFSNELALCMAQPYYSKQQVNDIIAKYGANTLIKERNLKGRSLLNRNSSNEFKFAHKSFMEFLVAMELFKHEKDIPIESIDCVSNDMIPLFLSYMIYRKFPSGSDFLERCRIDLHYSDKLSIKIENAKKFTENELNFYIESDFSDNLPKYLLALIFNDHNINLGHTFRYIDGRYVEISGHVDTTLHIKYHYNYNKIADLSKDAILRLNSNNRQQKRISLPHLIIYYDYLGDININLVLFLEKTRHLYNNITIFTGFDMDYIIIIKWNYWIFERLNEIDPFIEIQRPNGHHTFLKKLLDRANNESSVW